MCMVVMEQCTSQEEQAGGSSANYDVELIHLAESHRDILRAGACVLEPFVQNYHTYLAYMCM